MSQCSSADFSAMFSSKFSFQHSAVISAAPLQTPAMSSPAKAAGTSPTAERTLKRHPRFGNVEGDEIVRRGELLQVTVAFAGHGDNARGRFLCAQLRLQPFVHDEKRAHGLSRGAGLGNRHDDGPGRFHRLERRLDEDRSTLSRITSRGFFVENAACTGCGPRRPQSSAHAPSALPPMPTTQNRVIGPGDRFGVGLDLADQRRLEGQVRNPYSPASARLWRPASAASPAGWARPLLRASARASRRPSRRRDWWDRNEWP